VDERLDFWGHISLLSPLNWTKYRPIWHPIPAIKIKYPAVSINLPPRLFQLYLKLTGLHFRQQTPSGHMPQLCKWHNYFSIIGIINNIKRQHRGVALVNLSTLYGSKSLTHDSFIHLFINLLIYSFIHSLSFSVLSFIIYALFLSNNLYRFSFNLVALTIIYYDIDNSLPFTSFTTRRYRCMCVTYTYRYISNHPNPFSSVHLFDNRHLRSNIFTHPPPRLLVGRWPPHPHFFSFLMFFMFLSVHLHVAHVYTP